MDCRKAIFIDIGLFTVGTLIGLCTNAKYSFHDVMLTE